MILSALIEDTIRPLLSRRSRLLKRLDGLKAELADVNDQLAIAIAPLDGPVKVAGYGSVTISKPTTRRTFSPERLRELVTSLREIGNEAMALEIEACQVETEVAGGLRVTKEKGR